MNQPESSVSRRRFLGLLGAGALAVALPGKAEPASAKKPNVLFIAVDDLRPGLGCFGNKEIHTPNIDRLAAGGVAFTQAYCNVPICMASRVGTLTGVRPEPGVQRCTEMKREYTTLQAQFGAHGYHTVSNGKVLHHMLDRPEDWSEPPWRSEEIYHGRSDWAGYNTYHIWQNPDSANYINPRTKRGPYFEFADVPDNAYQDGKVADKTIADLKRLAKGDKPFLIGCGFWRPHLPFNAPKKYWDLYDSSKITIADNRYRPKDLPATCKPSGEIDGYAKVKDRLKTEDFHREARHAYYACVSYVDAQVGRVLDELDRLGIADSTIVVLCVDHGWNLGEHNFWGKHNTLEHSLHVPLIIRAPGHARGKPAASLVENVDIYPTLCDLAGVPRPAYLEGASLVPILDDPKHTVKQAVFGRWGNGRIVRTDRYSYTEWETGERMLFDHKTDPGENANVAEDPKNAEAIAELRKLLAAQKT